jgi:hypothetical protein
VAHIFSCRYKKMRNCHLRADVFIFLKYLKLISITFHIERYIFLTIISVINCRLVKLAGCVGNIDRQEMNTKLSSVNLTGRRYLGCLGKHSSPSQWPCDLRHELSSPIRTLGSWVRIPLKVWMSVCVYSVFVLFCM